MFRAAQDDDAPAIAALLTEAFRRGGAPAVDPARVGVADRYLLTAAEGVVATATATPVGQHVGGAVLPTAAVRAVAVSDVGRGRGTGRRLMTQLLDDLRSQGVVQSVLYPSVPAPYRAVGYEIAGERRVLRAPLHALPVAGGELPVHEWDDSQLGEVAWCYETFAGRTSGLFERPLAWWKEIVVPSSGGAPLYRRAVREAGMVTGYVVYAKDLKQADLDYYYDVTVRDVAWTTAAAGRSLLSFLAGHRGLGVDVRWPAPPSDPWITQLGPSVPRVDFAYPWMLRLIDPLAALRARRYPRWARATLRITVIDPILEPKARTLELTVTDGRASIEQVSAPGAARIDVGALGALHSGWTTATDLVRAGRLQDAGPDELELLDSLFLGPRPWLMEMF